MSVNHFEMPVKYASPGEVIVRMREITKVFDTTAGEVAVLKDINIEVCQGEFVSVVGRSGSGKSTLVNMLTGIDHPTSGTVQVGEVQIEHLPESRMAVWRGKNLGIVFQFFQLLPMLTLIENVMLPMDFCNIYSPASREERALGLLRRVGLEGLAHKLPGAVAGGQQQSAAVARALATDPPILIADEPTGNLDSQTAEQVMGIFEELAAQGKTILMVTHDRTLAQRTSRMLLLSDGELVNEVIANAFLDLPHTTLLQLSKRAHEMTLAAGERLPAVHGLPSAAPVYLVASGELICAQGGTTSHIISGKMLDPLARRGSWRAGGQGASLLALPRKLKQEETPGGEQHAASLA